MNSIWAAGLMSGTSLDGTIDVALIKTDGIIVEKFSSFKSYTYSDISKLLKDNNFKLIQMKLERV